MYLIYCEGGNPLVPDSEWPCYEAQARAWVEYFKGIYSFEPDSDTVPGDNGLRSELTMTEKSICSVAETLYSFALASSGGNADGATSLSVGSVKVGYGSAPSSLDLSDKALSRAVYASANRYLHFYRGVR